MTLTQEEALELRAAVERIQQAVEAQEGATVQIDAKDLTTVIYALRDAYE